MESPHGGRRQVEWWERGTAAEADNSNRNWRLLKTYASHSGFYAAVLLPLLESYGYGSKSWMVQHELGASLPWTNSLTTTRPGSILNRLKEAPNTERQ